MARSQTFSVLSSERGDGPRAVGRHRHGSDRVGVAFEGAEEPAGGQVPDLQRRIVGARRRPACRRALTATALTQSAWPLRVRSSLPVVEVPDLQRVVVGARRRPACRRASPPRQ